MSKDPIHVLPVDGSDIIKHIDSSECPCNPVKEFKLNYEVPVYIHNKLKDKPQ